MKLPGEAWLEFRIDEQGVLTQTATFRPKRLNGLLYWYAVSPLHTTSLRECSGVSQGTCKAGLGW